MRKRTLAAGLAAAGLVTGTLATLTASPAQAGGVNQWTVISQGAITNSGGGFNVADPDLLRLGDGRLGVVYPYLASGVGGYRYVTVDATGNPGATTTVAGGLTTVNAHPQVLPRDNGAAQIVFEGLHGGDDPSNPDQAGLRSVTTTAPGSYSTSLADPGAFGASGVSASTGGGANTFGYVNNEKLAWRTGFSTEKTYAWPAGTNLWDLSTATAGDGSIWAVYRAEDTANEGTYAQQLSPSVGSPVALPGSVGANVLQPNQSESLARRPDGSLWTAYCLGSTTCTGLRLKQVNGQGQVDVPGSAGAEIFDVASDGQGRLWATWAVREGAGPSVVRTTRSNPSLTAFGPMQEIAKPTNDGPFPDIFQLDTSAQDTKIDVVVNTGTLIQHTQLGTGFTVTEVGRAPWVKKVKIPGKKKRKNRRVGYWHRYTVTDAGVGVPGITIRAGSSSCVTDATGTCAIPIPGKVLPKQKKARKRAKRKGSGDVVVIAYDGPLADYTTQSVLSLRGWIPPR